MRSRKQSSWIRDPHPKQIESNCPTSHMELTRRQNKATSPLSLQSSMNQANHHRVIPLIKRKRYQFFHSFNYSNQTRGTAPECFQHNTQTQENQRKASKQSKRQIHTPGKRSTHTVPARNQFHLNQLHLVESGRIKSIELTQLSSNNCNGAILHLHNKIEICRQKL